MSLFACELLIMRSSDLKLPYLNFGTVPNSCGKGTSDFPSTYETHMRITRAFMLQQAATVTCERSCTSFRNVIARHLLGDRQMILSHQSFTEDLMSFGGKMRSTLGEYAAASSNFLDRNDLEIMVKLLETVGILMYQLMRARDVMDVGAALTQFLGCHLSTSVTDTVLTLLGIWCGDSDLAFQNLDEEECEFPVFGPDKEPWTNKMFRGFDSMESMMTAFDSFKESMLFKKVHRVAAYACSISIFKNIGLDVNPAHFGLLDKHLVEANFFNGTDFTFCLLNTVLFLCKTGAQCISKGSWEPLLHSAETYQVWINKAQDIRVKAQFLSAPEPHDITRFEFMNTLTSLIEQGEAMVKWMKKDQAYEKKIIHNLLGDLKLIKANVLSRNYAAKERAAPYGVLIYGSTSVAKSTFSKLLFLVYGRVVGLPTDDEYLYSRNPVDQYWVNFVSSMWAIRFDEVAYLRPSKAPGVDPSNSEILQVANNVPFIPVQAGIDDKGRTPVVAEFFMATTNTRDLNVKEYYMNGSAVLRRFNMVIDLVPKKEYSKPNGMFEPANIPEEKDREGFPDYWDIVVYNVEPVIPKTKVLDDLRKKLGNNNPDFRQNQDFQFIEIARFSSIQKFIVFYRDRIKAHRANQAIVLKCDQYMKEITFCESCRLPEYMCECLHQQAHHVDELIMKARQERIDEAIKNYEGTQEALQRTLDTDIALTPGVFSSVRRAIIRALAVLYCRSGTLRRTVTWFVSDDFISHCAKSALSDKKLWETVLNRAGLIIWNEIRRPKWMLSLIAILTFAVGTYKLTKFIKAPPEVKFDLEQIKQEVSSLTPGTTLTVETRGSELAYEYISIHDYLTDFKRFSMDYYIFYPLPGGQRAVLAKDLYPLLKEAFKEPNMTFKEIVEAVKPQDLLVVETKDDKNLAYKYMTCSGFLNGRYAYDVSNKIFIPCRGGQQAMLISEFLDLLPPAMLSHQGLITTVKAESFDQDGVWYKGDYRTTPFDVGPSSVSLKGLPIAEFQKRIQRNLVCVCVILRDGEEGTRKLRWNRAFCVADRLFAINSHAFTTDCEVFQTLGHWIIEIYRSPREGGVTDNIMNLHVYPSNIVIVPQSDTVYLWLDIMNPNKNLLGYLPSKSLRGGHNGHYLARGKDGELVTPLSVVNVRYVSDYITNADGPCGYWEGVASDYTVVGDCGSIFVSDSEFGPVILGLHSLGDDFKRVRQVGITPLWREDADQILQRFVDCPIDSGELQLKYPGKEMKLTDLHFKSPFRYFQSGVAGVYGSFVGARSHPKSHLQQTPLCQYLIDAGYPLEFGKPVMNGWMPKRNSAIDMLNPVMNIDRTILLRIVDSMFVEFLMRAPQELLDSLGPVDLHTAINGVDGIAHMDRVDISTSVGFPYKAPKKKFVVALEPEKGLEGKITFNDEIMQLVKECEECYKQGRRYNPIFTGNLKDEARKWKKIEAKLTRLFMGAPVAFVIVFRKYFLTLLRAIYTHHELFEAAPGIASNTTEWSGLATALSRFKRVIDGDFANYDKQAIKAIIMFFVFRYMVMIMKHSGKYDEEDIRVIWGMCADCSHPFIDFFGDLIMIFGMNPSGNPATVIFNCIANSILMRYAYYMCNPNKEVESFRENVVLFSYGDDNTQSISDNIPWYNQVSITAALASIGITYTDADKNESPLLYKELNDCSFLKRGFKYSDDLQCIVAPLEFSSIRKSLMVQVRSRSVTREEQCVSAVGSAIREYFLHGREVFETERSFLMKAVADCGLSDWVVESTFPTWEEEEARFRENSSKRTFR